MAQTMMHLLVAEIIYSSKCIPIWSIGDFLLGSIAPDAVHMKENYVRDMKDISHYGFSRQSSIHFFDTFMAKYENATNQDFAYGYLVHLLSDMIWYHEVRVPFKECFAQNPSKDMSMNEAYYADCEQLEQMLYEDEKAADVIESLKVSNAITLEGLIEAEDVEKWKEALLTKYSGRTRITNDTYYISKAQVDDYIAKCAKKCLVYLEEQGLTCK